MGQINNLAQGNLEDIYRRLRALEYASNQNNMAIGRGGLRVHSGGGVTIENGGLSVTGSGTFVGTLYADGTVAFTGTFTQSGPSTFTGDTSLNGPTHVNGNTDITGALDVDGTLNINGASTLNNNLNVQGGGKITAGVTQINPGGSIDFGTGLTITPDNGSGDAAIMAGASQIVLTPDNPDYWAQFTGGAYFQGLIRGMGLKLSSLPTTTQPANLHIDAAGLVSKSTA